MVKALFFDCFGVLYVPVQGRFVRNEPLLQFATALRRNYKVGLLSNLGVESMNNYFTVDERAGLFDATIISGEVGVTKPRPEIFLYACNKFGIEPNEAVMIDDSPDNCAGAQAAGLTAILYEDFPQMQSALRSLLK